MIDPIVSNYTIPNSDTLGGNPMRFAGFGFTPASLGVKTLYRITSWSYGANSDRFGVMLESNVGTESPYPFLIVMGELDAVCRAASNHPNQVQHLIFQVDATARRDRRWKLTLLSSDEVAQHTRPAA